MSILLIKLYYLEAPRKELAYALSIIVIIINPIYRLETEA